MGRPVSTSHAQRPTEKQRLLARTYSALKFLAYSGLESVVLSFWVRDSEPERASRMLGRGQILLFTVSTDFTSAPNGTVGSGMGRRCVHCLWPSMDPGFPFCSLLYPKP